VEEFRKELMAALSKWVAGGSATAIKKSPALTLAPEKKLSDSGPQKKLPLATPPTIPAPSASPAPKKTPTAPTAKIPDEITLAAPLEVKRPPTTATEPVRVPIYAKDGTAVAERGFKQTAIVLVSVFVVIILFIIFYFSSPERIRERLKLVSLNKSQTWSQGKAARDHSDRPLEQRDKSG
jgi:hypothetical protein